MARARSKSPTRRKKSPSPAPRKKRAAAARKRPARSPSPAPKTDRSEASDDSDDSDGSSDAAASSPLARVCSGDRHGTTAHDRLTCVELRAALKLRGLDTTGRKAALLDRLSAADTRAAASPSATGTAGPDGAAASSSTMTDTVTAAKGQLVRASQSLRTLSDPNDIYNAWFGADNTTASTASPTLGHGGVTKIASPPKAVVQGLVVALVNLAQMCRE